MSNLCLLFNDGNIKKDPRGKLRVVSSQNSVWYSISLQSTQNFSPDTPTVLAGHCSQRKPPRMRGEQVEPPWHTLSGHVSYFLCRMSISQLSPEKYQRNCLNIKEILIVCPNKYQEITNIWSVSEWLCAYINVFFGKFENGVQANTVGPYISELQLLVYTDTNN